MAGEVRCGRIVHYRDKSGADKKHPRIEGFTNVNVTSGDRSRYGWKALSPMFLNCSQCAELRSGVYDAPDPGFRELDDIEAKSILVDYPEHKRDAWQIIDNPNAIFESYWQTSKILKSDIDDFDPDRKIEIKDLNDSFFMRRASGIDDVKGRRHPLPAPGGKKAENAYTGFIFYNGEIITHLEARKRFYCPIYSTLILRTDDNPDAYKCWAMLEEWHNSGTNIQIIGFDGKDVPVNKEDMINAIDDSSWPFGHELVLTCMLSGIKVWY